MLFYFLRQKSRQNTNGAIVSSPSPTTTITPTVTPTATNQSGQFTYPINEFTTRITKKLFGIYITPQNSPIQPERFTGYHTGVDIEYQDVTTDVPVYAFTDGEVVASQTVLGYGGVFIIKFTWNGKEHTALYGHIRPSSLPALGHVNKRDKIAVLGTGYGSETDGERRHLHFAILSDARIDYRGYAQTQSELSSWIDPLTLYNP